MLTLHAVHGLLSSALITLAACQEAVAAADAQVVQEQKIDAPLLAQLGASGVLPVAILLKSQFLLGPDGLKDFASQNGSRARSELRIEVVRTLKQAASTEQAAVLEALGSPAAARGLWIANAIFVSLSAEDIRAASAHELVRYIYSMRRAAPSYDDPGTVSTVLTPAPRPSFSVEDKRIPWNVESIGASGVWDEFAVTGEGVVVAMIDNGTNYTHPDLTSNMWTNPDEVANNGVDEDANGLIDDYYGFDFYRGLAEVQLNPALGGSAGHGTDVSTMSFSLPDLENIRGLWRLMADHSVAAGLVMVSGAGNFQQSAPMGMQQRIPEGIPSVISVGGVDQALQLVPFSSLGPVSWTSVAFYGDHATLTKPDVAAFPGPEYPLITAEGSGYLDPNTRRGNSFSGPHATGVAALILSANPELPAWQVKEIMEQTARDLSPDGKDDRTGAGLIDAVAAVREALAR
jgi:subtilisin family serine protease